MHCIQDPKMELELEAVFGGTEVFESESLSRKILSINDSTCLLCPSPHLSTV